MCVCEQLTVYQSFNFCFLDNNGGVSLHTSSVNAKCTLFRLFSSGDDDCDNKSSSHCKEVIDRLILNPSCLKTLLFELVLFLMRCIVGGVLISIHMALRREQIVAC